MFPITNDVFVNLEDIEEESEIFKILFVFFYDAVLVFRVWDGRVVVVYCGKIFSYCSIILLQTI